ncbi:hypothetical protein DSL92_02625 [Billgrantia gudaonensis]|uniref:UPF0261 domain-containing protein n=1 Tax=Billgrantia gudaonensis TaxID=376427 RepID=A0A432JL72_9GAMM|nr:hypothetical protein DSL92_02625 [Halomonas gudaonensis]
MRGWGAGSARSSTAAGAIALPAARRRVSALDAPGHPFHDPQADAALFAALEATVRQTPSAA